MRNNGKSTKNSARDLNCPPSFARIVRNYGISAQKRRRNATSFANATLAMEQSLHELPKFSTFWSNKECEKAIDELNYRESQHRRDWHGFAIPHVRSKNTRELLICYCAI
jgi:hypothetical protein